jgi:hypothetical protein
MDEPVEMAAEWSASLRDRGYAQLSRLVPAGLIEAARTAIEEDLRLRYDAKRELQYSSRSYCPDLLGTRPIMDLLERSPVRDVVDAALGLDTVKWDRGQIALRRARDADREHLPEPHLDGFAHARNGVPQGRICNHTATIGVFLTTTPRTFAGNLTVWPGTHHRYEEYFRARGPRAMREPMPAIDLGAPVQLLCEAGDVVLLHYELAHTAAVNTADVDRIAVYFRLRLRNIDRQRWECLTHLWRGWRIADSP